MQKEILIIGAGPAGIVCASTAKKYYPDKKVAIIKEKEKGVVPCGIPYMIFSLKSPQENILSTKKLEDMGIEVIVDKVVKIERREKKIFTQNGNMYSYEKLVLSLGSKPMIPPISGVEKENIFSIYKDLDYLKKMVEKIKKAKNIVVLGGGFIGIEFADEISKWEGKNVYLVELLPRLLSNSFDEEFSHFAEEKLREKGVNILTNRKVVEFIGEGKVEKVKFSNGETLDADCVILGIGAFPNTDLARECGLSLGKGKGIWVDEYMRTEDKDIFAVGDCAGKRDFFTRKDAPVLLASIATSEARIAGANLYQVKIVRENKGTVGIYSTYIDGLVLGSAGLTEKTAKDEGFEVVIGNFEGVDKHPSTIPGAKKIKVKLIFSKHSGIIMGGQVAGGVSCGELINTIGVAIQKRVSFSELETLQIATHPCLTSAPTIYPLVLASQEVAKKFG